MDYRTRALIWLEIAKRSVAFKEQATALVDEWLTLAYLEEVCRRRDSERQAKSN